MRLSIGVLAIIGCLALPAFAGDLPDPALTPGDVRPDVTKDDLCPATSFSPVRRVPSSLKQEVYARYRLAETHSSYCGGGCELDHLIPLELGGSNEITNHWPQPFSGTKWNAKVKDKLENKLHQMVCNGELSLDVAQREIRTNWIDAYKKHLGNN